MNKTLRTMFACMLMMFGMTAMAEDVIWSEDFSAVTDFNANPATVYPDYTFTGTVLNEDGTAKSGTKFYNEKSAGGTAPELLIAKGGGSFAATIALNGKSGEMILSYMANYDRIVVTAEGATLGEKTKSGNNYTIPVTVAQGTASIKLVFTNTNTSSNVRFDDAKLYQGVAKKNAGLSWGTGSRDVTIGSEDNKFPTLQNENQLPVTYSISVETVATIDKEGNITLVAAGETVISAAFAGNDEFEAQTVSYTLKVKEASGGRQSGDDEVKVVTVAQFIAAEVSTEVWYKLTGTVKNITNTQYGNFDLEDETGSIYVYGLLSEKGGQKGQFQALANEKDIKEGSKLTLIGKRGVHNDKAQVTDAYFVSVDNTGVTPEPPVELEGDGTKENPYTVADVKAIKESEFPTEKVWVKGFIVGTLASATKFNAEDVASNIALAATANEAEAKNTIPVQLQKGDIRTALNLQDNAGNLGKLVKVHGKISTYFTVNGVIELDEYELEGTTAIKSIATESEAEVFNLQGQRVEKAVKGLYIINGKKVIVK